MPPPPGGYWPDTIWQEGEAAREWGLAGLGALTFLPPSAGTVIPSLRRDLNALLCKNERALFVIFLVACCDTIDSENTPSNLTTNFLYVPPLPPPACGRRTSSRGTRPSGSWSSSRSRASRTCPRPGRSPLPPRIPSFLP